METTLIKLATMSVMALAVVSTATNAAQAVPSSTPVRPVAALDGPSGGDKSIEEEVEQVAERGICKVSGILGWVGGMIGGNDVCGDAYDEQP